MVELKKHQELKEELRGHKHFLDKVKKEVMTEMEFNWKIMHAIRETMSERNFLYDILRDIELFCEKASDDSTNKKNIMEILSRVPEDFKPVDDPEIVKQMKANKVSKSANILDGLEDQLQEGQRKNSGAVKATPKPGLSANKQNSNSKANNIGEEVDIDAHHDINMPKIDLDGINKVAKAAESQRSKSKRQIGSKKNSESKHTFVEPNSGRKERGEGNSNSAVPTPTAGINNKNTESRKSIAQMTPKTGSASTGIPPKSRREETGTKPEAKNDLADDIISKLKQEFLEKKAPVIEDQEVEANFSPLKHENEPDDEDIQFEEDVDDINMA